MKTALRFMLIFTLTAGPLSAGEWPPSARDKLRAVQGDDKVLAADLLRAVESGGDQEIYVSIHRTMKEGRWPLIAILLQDPNETAKQAAAQALEELPALYSGIEVARHLLKGYDLLEFAVMGGEQAIQRADTTRIFEHALSEVTGVTLRPEWTKAQKRAALAKYFAAYAPAK